jgi:hypothetical protein
MRSIRIVLLAMPLALWACTGGSSSPAPSPPASSGSLVLRETPADLGCDAIGVDYQSVTFHIDPSAAEQVSAMTDTAVALVTHWPAGFTGDTAAGVIQDGAGTVVVTDGDMLQNGQQLGGYDVCLSPSDLYVMVPAPGG